MKNENLGIIIPTYNEKDNIGKLLMALLSIVPGCQIVVVDDDSPDGTAEIVRKFALEYPNITLLWRQNQRGMASAYIDAFARLIPDDRIVRVVTMDADFSHHPGDLTKILIHADDFDIVIGSRYVDGGRIENWAGWRKYISKYGNIYTRLVLRSPIRDLTAGFTLYSREILAQLLIHMRDAHPYAFQTAMKHFALQCGATYKEVPITFRERGKGESKLKKQAILEALFFPWILMTKKIR